MKTTAKLISLALLGAFAGVASASTDAQRIDLNYSGNTCEKCWAKTSDSSTGSNASTSSDTVYFHSEGEAHARAEMRMYTKTGARTFVGYMTPKYWGSGTGDISVFQIFSEESGKPRIMLGLDYSGYFYNESTGDRCSNSVRAYVGTKYKITATYDATKGSATVSIDGVKCTSVSESTSEGQLYVKLGAYRTNSGAGSFTAKWESFTDQ